MKALARIRAFWRFLRGAAALTRFAIRVSVAVLGIIYRLTRSALRNLMPVILTILARRARRGQLRARWYWLAAVALLAVWLGNTFVIHAGATERLMSSLEAGTVFVICVVLMDWWEEYRGDTGIGIADELDTYLNLQGETRGDSPSEPPSETASSEAPPRSPSIPAL